MKECEKKMKKKKSDRKKRFFDIFVVFGVKLEVLSVKC